MKQGAPEPIAALNRVRIQESGEPLVDIRTFCPAVEVMERRVCPYLRRTVAEMLNRAASHLPEGYRFRVGTALRTLSMQKRGWDRYYRRLQKEHPEWPVSALRRATNRYFAPYDQPAPPGHCTGGAVDVILLLPNGRPADVTSPFERWEAAYTWISGLSFQAHHNRMMMVSAMLDAGFSNCREEFWHYSWGDSAWAVRVGERVCPYGWIDPPVAVESGFKGGIAAEIVRTADQEWRVRAPASGNLSIGVFWSLGRPVTLHLEGLRSFSGLQLSKDHKVWRPLAEASARGTVTVRLTPRWDRVYIRTTPDSSPGQ